MRYLILIFLTVVLYGDSYEKKLYEKVLPLVFGHKPIRVYVDEDMKSLLKDSSFFVLVEHCDESVDILIGKNFQNLSSVCKTKPLFSTSYRVYRKNPNSFGAFYWRKGRPQLKFKKDGLKKFSISLPKTLQKYVQ